MQQANAGGDREGGDREAEKKKRPILPETSYQKPWLGGSDGTTSHCQTAEKRQAPAPQPGRGASVTFARFTHPTRRTTSLSIGGVWNPPDTF